MIFQGEQSYGRITYEMNVKPYILTSLGFAIFYGLIFMQGLHAAQPCLGLNCAGEVYKYQRTAQNTTVLNITSQPDLFDETYVHFTGEILSIEQGSSRRGHPYNIFTVSDLRSNPAGSSLKLRILAFLWPSVKKGDTITVQGTYHTDYWFAGWPTENFIDAEVIRVKSVTLIQPISPNEETGEFVRSGTPQSSK